LKASNLDLSDIQAMKSPEAQDSGGSISEQLEALKESLAAKEVEITELKALNLDLSKRFDEEGTKVVGGDEKCTALEGQLYEWQQWGEAKTQEYNTLLEAYNGYVEAHNNQAQEIASLKETHGHLTEEIDKLREAVEAKEAEVKDLRSVHHSAVQKSEAVPEHAPEDKDDEDGGGWGDPSEDDVIVPDVPVGETIAQLEREVTELRAKLTQAEEDKKSLDGEVTTAKVKAGKLTLKVKNLTKEVETLKKKAKSGGASGGGSDGLLDSFVQSEINEQIEKGEKEARELKKQLESLTQEKQKLADQVDTLAAGNERFVEMKEQQDNQVEMLQAHQAELKRQVDTLQWEMSEKTAEITDLQEQLSIVKPVTTPGDDSNQGSTEGTADLSGENTQLRLELNGLRKSLAAAEGEVSELRSHIDALQEEVTSLTDQLREKASSMVDVQDKLDQMTEENEILKNVESECESLKLKLDTMQKAVPQVITSDDQLKGHLAKLEQEVAEKEEALARMTAKAAAAVAARERHESTSTEEIGGFLQGSTGDVSSADANLMSENLRLQQDLTSSVHESRNLAKQMATWKEQLAADTFDSGSGSGSFDSGTFVDPEANRAKQEQACRSVGALQLRVEELTLEVTKLLEERDTLQLKLSNVMRQFERHKESVSRASTACSTPVPWPAPANPAIEVRELKQKIDELGKLNYSLDVQLQKEREDRKQMQASLRAGTPTAAAQFHSHHHHHHHSTSSRSSPRVLDNRESTSPESSAGAIFDV